MTVRRQIDFAPSVYEHAAALIGLTPYQVSRDPDLLFRAHAEAFRLYRHAPVVVGIDIYNLEAEGYGASISEPADNAVPAISERRRCPTCADLLHLRPLDPARDGRLPMVLSAAKRLAGAFPEANVRIPVSGPFSLASNLVGFDRLLCDVLDEPGTVRKALLFLARGQLAFCREIALRGLGVALFESGAAPPLISPELFAQLELPALALLVNEASALAGRPAPCIIGGNTLPILKPLLQTGAGYVICPSETDQAAFMRAMRDRPDVMVRINTDACVFASGSEAAVCRELDRVLALAEDRERVCVGTGTLPFETAPSLVLKAKEYVRSRAGNPCESTGE
jgi:uroporphyrinogen decarboxylase